MASALPVASLRLLIPPLRLLAAAMWQVAHQQSVKHFGMLEDFVSLVTEAVPQLLTERQRSLLLLALRAKATLSNPEPRGVHVQPERTSYYTEADEDVNRCSSAWLSVSKMLSQHPAEHRRLLQEVFNQNFDSALQSLVCDLLTRIEQLFPVPDFKQAASLLVAAPGGVEDCLQEADREELKVLLTNQSCLKERLMATGTESLRQFSSVGEETEKILLSAWSHPLVSQLADPKPKAQSNAPLAAVSPAQLEVELMKVVLMPKGNREEVHGADVGSADPDTSDEQRVVAEEDGFEASSGHYVDQSEEPRDRVGQSQQSSPEVATNVLWGISHNSQRVAHKCPQCGKCFIYRSQVIRHLRSNKSCAQALAAGGSSQASPEGRAEELRPLRLHTCFQCGDVFKGKAELLLHQRSHRARTFYQCDRCGREFRYLSSLSNHKQTHLGGGGGASDSGREADDRRRQQQQQQQQHSVDLTCTVCDKTFSSQTSLLRHLQTHSVEGAEPSYKCRHCDQSFSGVTQLRIHQRTHTCRSYQCDQCAKTYSSLTGLQSHRASGHGSESRFLCPQCGKRFKTRDGLEGHLRTHTGERPYRCPYCPKDFTALAGLNVHVRRHTGERPYVCDVCGKGWPSGGDLQKHMRTHTGERPYVCQDCGKAFSISCHLTEHRRIHTGEKPFSCPECGKCLRRKFDLKKHMLSHSSVRPHTCVHCPKSYTRKTHLNRHLQSHRTGDGGAAEDEAEAEEEA